MHETLRGLKLLEYEALRGLKLLVYEALSKGKANFKLHNEVDLYIRAMSTGCSTSSKQLIPACC